MQDPQCLPKALTLSALTLPLLTGLAGCAQTPPVEPSEGSSAAELTERQIAVADPVPDPDFDVEEALETFDLAWESVEEYHFDPEFNGVDWSAVREELRPEVQSAESMSEVRNIIDDMLGRLGQSHFARMPAKSLPKQTGDGVQGGIGIELRLRNDQLLVTSVDDGLPAAEAGVAPGWVVVEARGVEVSDTLEDMRAAVDDERTVAFAVSEAIYNVVRGDIGREVEVEFLNAEDEVVELDLERVERNSIAHSFSETLPTFHLVFEEETVEQDGKRFGRIHFTNWFTPMMEPINRAVNEMRDYDGIVIDLRGNTGGAAGMTMGVAGHFFDEKVELGKMTQRDSEMKIVALPRRTYAGKRVKPYSGPVAILTDERTASASEVFAGGMQSLGRVRVFGDTTAGAVLPARTTLLPNGDALLHAMGDFRAADGTLLEGRGVIPDEVVPILRKDLLAGHDAVFQAALDWLKTQSPPQ